VEAALSILLLRAVVAVVAQELGALEGIVALSLEKILEAVFQQKHH
jgi:hypothetical protein